jgi:hypothetical protein
MSIRTLEEINSRFLAKYPLDSRVQNAILALNRKTISRNVLYQQIDIVRKVLSEVKEDERMHEDVSWSLYWDVRDVLDALIKAAE